MNVCRKRSELLRDLVRILEDIEFLTAKRLNACCVDDEIEFESTGEALKAKRLEHSRLLQTIAQHAREHGCEIPKPGSWDKFRHRENIEHLA